MGLCQLLWQPIRYLARITEFIDSLEIEEVSTVGPLRCTLRGKTGAVLAAFDEVRL